MATTTSLNKEQERIASVLAYCSAHADTDDETRLIEWVAEKFADDLAAGRARFDRVAFMKAVA